MLLFMSLSFLMLAQSPSSIYPNVQYSDLHAIAVEGDHIFTAGDCGINMVSSNGGADWTVVESEYNFTNIEIIPGTNGTQALFQARQFVMLLDITTQTFQEVTTTELLLESGILKNIFVADGKAYLVATYKIYESAIGIYEWSELADTDLDIEDDFIGKADMGDSHIFIGSHEGKCLSVDLNTGSINTLFDFGNRVNDITMVNDDLGYATVSTQSGIFKTLDGGFTWSTLPGGLEGINPIAYGEDVIISVNTNRLYISTDGGQTATYRQMADDLYSDLNGAAYMTEDGLLYICGASNMILKSADFGINIENLNNYKRANLRAIHIAENGLGYAFGYLGYLLKTTDHGETWVDVDLGLTTDIYATDLVVYQDGRAVLGHSDGTIIIENDVIVSENGLSTYSFIQIPDSDVIISSQPISSNATTLTRSTDRGETWTDIETIPISYQKLHRSPLGKIYACNNSSSVFTSADDGASWMEEIFGFDQIRAVNFLDDQNGIFVTGNQLYKTTDGGLNGISVSQGYLISNLQYFNDEVMFYTTAQDNMTNVFVSDNGGNNFSKINEFCSTSSGSFFDGTQTVWLAQDGGHINMIEVDALISGTNNQPNNPILFTVSPNPAMSGQVIQFDQQLVKSAELIAYDGRTIGRFNIDPIENNFTLPELPSGPYILKLKSEGAALVSRLIIR